MRCDLVAALLHRPSILFLDEPTVGLDSVAKLAFRDFIRDYNQQRGLTVILTTHDMDDIEALDSRVMVIGNGQILSDGPLDELRNRFGHERLLTVDFVEENVQFSDPQAVVVSHAGHRTKLRFNPNEIAASELISRVAAQHPVRDLFVENPPIEEIIARIYQENQL
jgi:ABC-2 type transport system ATP-binding protein